MNESQDKSLARRRFLSLLGKSAFGLWLLQLIPSGLTMIRPPAKKAAKSRNQVAAKVQVHPMAVKRET